MSHAEHDRSRSADASRSIAGFGLTAIGGLLIGVGALLPWIRSSIDGLPDELSPTYFGVDLPDGIVALAAAVIVLAGLVVTRLGSSSGARRRVAAIVIVAASVVAIGAAGVSLLTAASRFEPRVVDDVLDDLDPSQTATLEQREQVEEIVETRLATGPFAVLGGGVLALVGGVLLLSAERRSAEHEARVTNASDEPLPAPPEDDPS